MDLGSFIIFLQNNPLRIIRCEGGIVCGDAGNVEMKSVAMRRYVTSLVTTVSKSNAYHLMPPNATNYRKRGE